MDVGDVQRLVARVAVVDARCADRVALEAAARELRRLKSWVESREVTVARALRDVSSFPEKNLADAARTNLREAERVMRRARSSKRYPHHQKIHNDGWLLTLTPDHTLTIRTPDGQVMTTGPPKRNAA
jgi:hypothetical protein